MEEDVGRVSSSGIREQNFNYNERDGSGSLMGADNKVECSIEEARIEGDAIKGTPEDLGPKSEGPYSPSSMCNSFIGRYLRMRNALRINW
ncbi:hypothetical protein SLA2020_016860 [Shorea laevis]